MDTSSDSQHPKKKAFRRAHKKSHLGCNNCKQRRIKCNERLPMCGQCTKSKLPCSYLQLSQEEIELRSRKQQQQQQQQPSIHQHPGILTGSPVPPDSVMKSPYIEPPVISLPPINSMTPQPQQKLPPINQSVVLPALNNSLQSATSNPLVRQGFETDMIRGAYMNWMGLVMMDAYAYPPLYHACMAFSLGFMAIRSPEKQYAIESAKHRYLAIQQMQDELGKENVEHIDPLLASSVVLSWDVFFQDDNIRFYATLSKGLAAVLEKVHVMNTPTPAAACMTDALFQGIKAIQMPPYEHTFFAEFVAKARSIRPRFESDAYMLRQCDQLIAFAEDVWTFLQKNPMRAYRSSKSGAKYHSPQAMFAFVRRWFQIMPSEALAFKNHSMLYVYFHAATRALDALFPEVRYMFQFGFIGPVDLAGVENHILNKQHPDYAYPLKVLVFFKERLFLLNRLLVAKDPLSNSMDNQERIQEVAITVFENTSIGAEHYPSISSEMSPPSLASSASTASSETPSDQTLAGAPGGIDESRMMDIFKGYFYDRMEILGNVDE